MTDTANPIVLMKRRKPGSPDAGQWATDETSRKPKDTVIGCPGCSAEMWLSGFTISRRGAVTPQVGCPCGFNQFIKLGEWAPPRAKGARFRNDYPQT